MRRWTETLCCVTMLACAGCAGTIDDPASFEAYASRARDASIPDAGETGPSEVDAGETGPSEVDASETGPSEVDAGDEPVAACDFKALMQTSCGKSSCHGGPSASAGLDLTSDGLRDRLSSRSGSGPCADKRMIDDDAPEQSALYLMVTGNGCGIRMPLGGSLSADEQACVLSWITGP